MFIVELVFKQKSDLHLREEAIFGKVTLFRVGAFSVIQYDIILPRNLAAT